MFLNVTARTEILLCEETLEMILTVTAILPLVACYVFLLPGVDASSHEQLRRVTAFLNSESVAFTTLPHCFQANISF